MSPSPRLRDVHYRAVLDFVGDVHDAQDLDELRGMVLSSLRRMVPADYSSYNEIPSGAAGELFTVAEPELPAFAYTAWERHSNTNPLVAHFGRTRDGRPYRFSDVIDQAELRRMPIYRELYAPLGVEHQIAFVLPSQPTLLIGVALSRGARDFDDDEQAMLDLVRPHLIQAYRNAQLRERSIGLLETVRAGLDARGTAALVVDSSGALLLATGEGERLAAAVAISPLTTNRPLPEPLAGALAGPDQVASVTTRAGETVLVHRVRAPDGATVLFLERAARALTPATLRGLGLTAREADVLATLARGSSTGEAASELGITPRTVLKHTERIHRKLGVNDRAQAIATAWTASGVAAGS
jgi:DNA-binding CsgD family transcriptional regulator